MDQARSPCRLCVSKANMPDATAQDVKNAGLLLTQGQLSGHFKSKHAHLRHLCNVCGYGFSSRAVLNSHLEAAHGEAAPASPEKPVRSKKKRSRWYRWRWH